MAEKSEENKKHPKTQKIDRSENWSAARARKKPRGPKDQKNSRSRSRLKMSIENEIFERATHRGPIFCAEIETSRLKFSSEIKNFDRD